VIAGTGAGPKKAEVTLWNCRFPWSHAYSGLSWITRKLSSLQRSMAGMPNCTVYVKLVNTFFFLYLSESSNSHWHPNNCFLEGSHFQSMSSKMTYSDSASHLSKLKSPLKYICRPKERAQAVFPVLVGPYNNNPCRRTIYKQQYV